ncbi:MAG: methylmalonyl-CoA epimerase [Acidobacteria bacterium]|nr:methylmalonyl-CoA epimerase [Acidobacteriota bacterium]
MIKKIGHIGIATQSIAVTSEFYKTLGLQVNSLETVKDQKVRVAIIKVGDSAIELIEPTEEDSPISKFLEKRGEGIHHISLEVDNLEEQLKQLKEKNVQLIDSKPRLGAEGKLIAFVHPDSTGGVLVELCQAQAGEHE